MKDMNVTIIKKNRINPYFFFIFLLTSGGGIIFLIFLLLITRKTTKSVFVSSVEKKEKLEEFSRNFENFSLSEDAFLPTILVLSDEGSVAIVELREISKLLKCLFGMNLGSITKNTSFFAKNFQGLSSPNTSDFTLKIVIPRKIKKIFLPCLYYHANICNGKQCCSDFFINKNYDAATTLEDFNSFCLVNPKEKILDLSPGEVLVSLIHSINCFYPGVIAHCTSLIMIKDKDSSHLRAYYCDSFGQDMPEILRSFLKKLGLREENIDYLKFSQQMRSGYCAMFAIRNAKIVSELMLNGASFKEINENKKLKCRPSVECLKEARINFLNHCNKKLGKKIIERIKSFSLSIDKLIKRVDKVCSLEKGAFECLEIWRSKLLTISKLVEERFDSGEETTYLFFDLFSSNSFFSSFWEGEMTNSSISIYSEYIWYLNYVFFKVAERLLQIVEKSSIECADCKNVLKKRKEFCFLKSDNYDSSFFEKQSIKKNGIVVDVPIPNFAILKLEKSKKTCSVCKKYWSLEEVMKINNRQK